MLRLFAHRCAVVMVVATVVAVVAVVVAVVVVTVVVLVVIVLVVVATLVVVGSHPLHVLSQLSAAVSHNFRDRIV